MVNEFSRFDYLKDMLFPIYFWGFIILKPFLFLDNSQSTLILFAFTLIIMLIWLVLVIKSKRLRNLPTLAVMGIIIMLFTIDFSFRRNVFSMELIIEFFYSGIIVILLVSQIKDYDVTLKMFLNLSLIAFVMLFREPFIEYRYLSDYMGYGYTLLLPCFIISFIGYHHYKKKIFLVVEILCLVFSFLYGNRGAFLSIVFFIFLYFLYKRRINLLVVLSGVTTILIGIIIMNYHYGFVLSIFDSLNIDTYSIRQFQALFESGFTEAFFSGRLNLWNNAINMILNNAIIGNGIGHFQSVYNFYPHNVLLDMLLCYGIFLGIIAIGFLFRVSVKIFHEKGSAGLFGLMLFGLCFPRLLLSSYFVNNMSFWAFIAFGCYMLFSRKYEVPDLSTAN